MVQQDARWAGAVEITESDVALVANLLNDCIAKIDPFRFRLNLNGDFTMKPWYKEIITLIRLMNKIEAKPRLYIQAQIAEYRKPCKIAREVPTIKMMYSPAGIDRYQRFLDKMGMTSSKYHKVTVEEMMDFSKTQMVTIMKRLNIPNEQEFFKDPYLVAQLSASFVKNNLNFIKLESEGFYKKKFGITGEGMLP